MRKTVEQIFYDNAVYVANKGDEARMWLEVDGQSSDYIMGLEGFEKAMQAYADQEVKAATDSTVEAIMEKMKVNEDDQYSKGYNDALTALLHYHTHQ